MLEIINKDKYRENFVYAMEAIIYTI